MTDGASMLAAALERRDLSQNQAAALLAVRQPTIWRWIRGKSIPSDAARRRILDVFHIAPGRWFDAERPAPRRRCA